MSVQFLRTLIFVAGGGLLAGYGLYRMAAQRSVSGAGLSAALIGAGSILTAAAVPRGTKAGTAMFYAGMLLLIAGGLSLVWGRASASP